MATGPWRYKFIDQSSGVRVQAGYFRNLSNQGYAGVVFRLGVGSTKDTMLESFYAQCKAEAPELLVGWYYVPNPLYSQAAGLAYVIQFIGSKVFNFGCGDYEITFGVGYSTYKNFMILFQQQLVARFDYLILCYSGAWFMDLLPADSRFLQFVYWLAVYYSSTSTYPPADQKPWALPKQITMAQVGMWQFYSHWHEAYSASDLDSSVAWREIDSVFEGQEPQPPATGGLKMLVLQEGLKIRSTPDASSPANIIGSLNAGQVLEASDVGGADSWIRHPAGWSNVQQGSDRNMQKAPE
jgi:hypothetical protein